MDSGQWTVNSGQWTVDSGQWAVDSEPEILGEFIVFPTYGAMKLRHE